MSRGFGHPRALSLSKYVDGDLSAKSRRRIEEHLDQCSACRAKVRDFRELGEAVRRQTSAGVPDVADQVIRRRAQGERVVLDTPPRRRALNPSILRAVAAVVLLAVGGAAMFLTLAPSASASRSELTFEPDAPIAGASIQVEYSPAYYLQDQDSLRLRARARKADTPFPRGGVIGELRVATLHRNADGQYSGHIQLEPDDVFLAAVVEDFEARNVDTNFGELWELLVRTEDGSPSTAALESRYRTLEPYNWIMASAWAEEVTQRWPENPFGWALLYFHESETRTEALPDSVVEFHRVKLADLVEARESGVEDPDGLAFLVTYARSLGDTRQQDSLFDRLSESDPNHKAVVNRRVTRAAAESRGKPLIRLAALEDIWETSDQSNESLVRLALRASVSAGDVGAARIWLARASQVEGVTTGQLLMLTRSSNDLAPDRVDILRALLDSLNAAGDIDRPLRSTREQDSADREAASLETKIMLAEELIDAGDSESAEVVLHEIREVVWKPQHLESIVEFLLTAGDTTAAVQGVGMLTADPIVGPTAAKRFDMLLSAARVDSMAFLEVASPELKHRVRSSLPYSRLLPDGISISVLGANDIESQDYFRDRPTVLLMWSAKLSDADQLKAEFESFAGEPWAVDRIRAAVLTADLDAPESELLADLSVPVIHDMGHGITEALGEFGIPSYIVIGSDRQVLAIAHEASTAFRIAYHLDSDR